ncbi:hypothetical protein F5141DRAFT_1066802 [Pisolithus sp. B1]|nr:hypothetical protein F5141DRAFT_1066802 [Pisolithus sp. B1]
MFRKYPSAFMHRCLFGLGWASDPLGGRVFPVKVYVLPEKVGHAANDGSREGVMNQMVVVVVQRQVHNISQSLVDMVEFEVDLLTSDDVQPLEGSESNTSRSRYGPLERKDVIQGLMIESLVDPDRQRTVTMLDDFLQVQLYSNTPATHASLAHLAPSLQLMLPTCTSSTLRPGSNNDALTHMQLVGHRLAFNNNVSMVHTTYLTWGSMLGFGKTIQETIQWKGRGTGALGKGSGRLVDVV